MVLWLYSNGYMPIFLAPLRKVSPGTAPPASSPRPSPPRVDSVERLRSELDYWRHLTETGRTAGNRCESPVQGVFHVVLWSGNKNDSPFGMTMIFAFCRCSLIFSWFCLGTQLAQVSREFSFLTSPDERVWLVVLPTCLELHPQDVKAP